MNVLTKSSVKLSTNGFSLAEILVALSLLAVAGTFVASKVYDRLTEGRIDSARIQINSLADRLKEYRRTCNTYPTTDQGLEALVAKPTSGKECLRYPPGGFIEDGVIPKDPWDKDYLYVSDGNTFDVYSYGPDEVENTADDIHYAKKGAGAQAAATNSSAPQAQVPNQPVANDMPAQQAPQQNEGGNGPQ